MARTQAAVDKRRLILDAAVRVFARQGFHTCRVSDIADEARVAYGLVYHYFKSKDEILDTLFLERWGILLRAITEVDEQEIPPREKLFAIAGFIVDSYRHDPDLMKVIIVEVTRAANTFGRTHLPQIRQAYIQIAAIVDRAQRRRLPRRRHSGFRRAGVLWRGRAGSDRLDLLVAPGRRQGIRECQDPYCRDHLRRTRACRGSARSRRES